MLDGWHDGQRVGSGTVIWHARNLMAAGKLDYEGFMTLATRPRPRSVTATPWARRCR